MYIILLLLLIFTSTIILIYKMSVYYCHVRDKAWSFLLENSNGDWNDGHMMQSTLTSEKA